MILLTVQQARAFEAAARERLSVPERALIARAGQAAFEFAGRKLGPVHGKRLAVLCGKGNNAADGLHMAARCAAEGAVVVAVLAFPARDLSPEAAWALQEARRSGVSVDEASDAAIAAALANADLAVDALVGTGARLPLEGSLAALVRALNGFKGLVLALDLASGLDADSGRCTDPCVRADWTLAFLGAKLGQALGEGPRCSGELSVDFLGCDEAWAPATASCFDLAAARQAMAPRPRDYHKKKAELLVIAGSKEYLGAALLCARGAYRCGAGLVRLALPEALAPFAQAALPEAVVAALPAGAALGEMHLEALLALAATAKAAVLGPGLGRADETLALVRELWDRLPMPAVFDADALFALRLGAAPGGERVLTPHEGELLRLLGPAALSQGRPAAARALAAAAAAVALLKGPSTLVARPDGSLSVNSEGGPELSTAGTGDVLSGAIGALLAQGTEAYTAACLGAWIHGRAGRDWRRAHGERGLLASDLADAMPSAQAEAFGT